MCSIAFNVTLLYQYAALPSYQLTPRARPFTVCVPLHHARPFTTHAPSPHACYARFFGVLTQGNREGRTISKQPVGAPRNGTKGHKAS